MSKLTKTQQEPPTKMDKVLQEFESTYIQYLYMKDELDKLVREMVKLHKVYVNLNKYAKEDKSAKK